MLLSARVLPASACAAASAFQTRVRWPIDDLRLCGVRLRTWAGEHYLTDWRHCADSARIELPVVLSLACSLLRHLVSTYGSGKGGGMGWG